MAMQLPMKPGIKIPLYHEREIIYTTDLQSSCYSYILLALYSIYSISVLGKATPSVGKDCITATGTLSHYLVHYTDLFYYHTYCLGSSAG